MAAVKNDRKVVLDNYRKAVKPKETIFKRPKSPKLTTDINVTLDNRTINKNVSSYNALETEILVAASKETTPKQM